MRVFSTSNNNEKKKKGVNTKTSRKKAQKPRARELLFVPAMMPAPTVPGFLTTSVAGVPQSHTFELKKKNK